MSKSERLLLVTDFDSLRAGMLVVFKPCGRCSRAHRGILVARLKNVCGQTPAHLRKWVADCWEMLPAAPCGEVPLGITPSAVDRRRVFRIVDDTEQATTTRARELETVR